MKKSIHTESKSCLVLGGSGFVGSAVVSMAARYGFTVQAVGRNEYAQARGSRCDLLINANGNSRKYLSRQNPVLDFQLSVESVLHSLLDFVADRYVFLSSIDVYNNVTDPACNKEDSPIDTARLSPYGFHKWLAEQLVRHHRPDALMLRMGGLVGPGLWKNPIFDLLNNAPLHVHPDSTYQYLRTHELARILFELVDAGVAGETFNVAGQGVISIREMAVLIPGVDLSGPLAAAMPEHYEINTDQLAQRLSLPETRTAARAFIGEVLAGHVAIGKPGAET